MFFCFFFSSGKFCFSVTSITLIEIGILPNAAVLLLLSRMLFLVVTMAYYYHLGRKPKKIWSDCMTLPGQGQLTTDHKHFVRRCGVSFDWGQSIIVECLRHWKPAFCNPDIQQISTMSYSKFYNNREKLSLKIRWSLDGLWGLHGCVGTYSFYSQSRILFEKEVAVQCIRFFYR